MKKLTLAITLALTLFTGFALAQPRLTSAANAAGYMRAGLPNGGLAQGSYIAIFGAGIGPAVPSTGIAVSGYPLQTTFQGVSARIGASNLLIVYASPTQVGAIVPSNTPLGTGSLTLTYNGQTSAPLSVQVIARALGLFTLNQGGSGPVVGLKFISQAEQPPSTLTEALNPGGVVTLYGTGLGAVTVPENQTVPATSLAVPGVAAADVSVTVGGRPATVLFVGRSSCCSAIDQLVIQLAADTPTGCYVSLILRVGGVTSNSSTVSVAPAGKRVCSDPNGFSEEQLNTLAAKGSFTQGIIAMTKASLSITAAGFTINQVSDSLSASFQRFTPAQLLFSQGDDNTLTFGSCRVYTFEGETATRVDPIAPAGLDAGTVTIQNSNGTQTLDRVASSPGLYSKTISPGLPGIPGLPSAGGPEFLTTGLHTARATGGTDVGAFTTSLTWPAAFLWSNQAAITSVNRNNALAINWSGGDPQGYVSITGFSVADVAGTKVGAGFTCLELASRGTFSVPAAILSSLPVSMSVQGAPLGQLSVFGIGRPGTFTATGLDRGAISYQSGTAKLIQYQ